MLGHKVSKSFTITLKIKEAGICIISPKLGSPRKAPQHFLMYHFIALAHYKAQQMHYRHINAIFTTSSSCTHFKHFITEMYEIPYESKSSSSIH